MRWEGLCHTGEGGASLETGTASRGEGVCACAALLAGGG